MEIRFPIVALAIAGVAVAIAVRRHFEKMKLTQLRYFELGRQSVINPTAKTEVSSSNFAMYVKEQTNVQP